MKSGRKHRNADAFSRVIAAVDKLRSATDQEELYISQLKEPWCSKLGEKVKRDEEGISYLMDPEELDDYWFQAHLRRVLCKSVTTRPEQDPLGRRGQPFLSREYIIGPQW
jgi:hypothetical protein